MLKVDHIYSGYGDLKIIKDVTFDVNKDETVLILGLNGAGKTTLLKSIAGFVKLFSGKIILDNNDITKLDSYKRAKLGITMIMEQAIFPDLTVKENMEIAHSKTRNSKFNDELNNILKTFPELKTFLKIKAQALSGGQRKMLSMAMALLSKPKLLILDEPSAGLSPLMVSRVVKYVSLLKENGITILIAEQNPSFIDVADKVMVLESGVIKLMGNASEIANNNEVRKTFFQVS
ncbi:ABC-type branched-chain amino acid transport systems, ATPase component [Caldisphaera lagunensis DSM 15908]|uniref:ABC-type branched-chain amino acid transport systems, ATPase component n=1 Tax=Caldisphaera lagunensis (strain DSM 15908 / JCM 11604 / ANMR 0165 / IC-154) TaxID=1056495 RepID=L0ABG3_CALLD|nr:ABC transporter ATP-binding protein [Caldisphaera lagunensis]AFZ70390.1 ABC-type branched-chain amino acid transport systems, ATPase component [Caldisphaera lagunensis DSM 15908]